MKLNDFDYALPKELIAQYPLTERDAARLMIIERKTGKITHDVFARIANYLPCESVIVLNDSKVIPARLFGKKEATNSEIEIFLLNALPDGYSFEALIRPLKKLKTGEKIFLKNAQGHTNGLYAELIDFEKRIVRFDVKNIINNLRSFGHMPLPPYIKRSDEPLDWEYYQTVYAKIPGSVAAPTAGLHFTEKLLTDLKGLGHRVESVTLHVNYATFNPVKVENISEHKMHTEEYSISRESFDVLKENRAKGKRIVAVGTTACRSLETSVKTGQLEGKTDIFIYPGFRFNMTDILVTNFHLPCSTLLMLVSAFMGHELMKKTYQEAIEERYRFFSYGDAMLIL